LLGKHVDGVPTPELLHAHFATDAAQCLPFIQRCRVPLVITCHGYDVTLADTSLARTPAGRMYLGRRSELFAAASLVIGISKFVAERAIASGAPRHKVITHYMGVDIPPRPSLESPRDGLLFVGRIVPKKGLDTLLDALAVWPSGDPPELTVVGDGQDAEVLRQRALDRRVNVSWRGALPHAETLSLMQRSRLLCMPSRRADNGDDEGLGLVGLEAQARGLPVVAGRTGGIPEFIEDEVTGRLVDPTRARDWAIALFDAYTDAGWQHTIARSAYESVLERFDRSKQGAALATLYDQTAGGQ
jgi:glycosyltransferase involved in cell wall biosynthesis